MENLQIEHVVTVLTMGLYGGTYLTDVLRRHGGKAPWRFMIIQYVSFWGFQSALLIAFDHKPIAVIWLGALHSAGATVIAKVSCWAYMYDESKERSRRREDKQRPN